MTTWNTYKLGDLYNVGSGLSKSRSEFGFGYPFVTFKDVFYNFFIPAELESLANTTEKERTTCSVKRGDIFLTRTSETMHELGMSAVALKDYENATFNGFTKRLRLKDKIAVKIDPVFIGYYFRTNHIRNQIGMHASMTTRASLNSTAINSIEIIIPGIEVQKRIGKILKSIDDKIELNRRMNQTLEQMAQTLFRQNFVDGIDEENLPKGWKNGKVSDLGKIICGKTPSKARPEFYEGEVPFIKIPDMHGETFIVSTIDSLSTQGASSQQNKYVPKGSICVSCIATVGLVSITTNPSQTNQQINTIVPRNETYSYYSYFLMKSKEQYLKDLGSGGTATLNVNTSLFSNIKVAIPNEESLYDFHHKVEPIMLKILSNQLENTKLSNLRDTLLPKLMSGEIDVMQIKPEELHEPVLS